MKLRFLVVAFFATGILGAASVAQEGATGGGVDPVAILRKADEALAAMRSMTFSARSEGVGATATRSPVVEGTVSVRRAGADVPWSFAADATVSPPGSVGAGRVRFAFDGKTCRMVDDDLRTVTESDVSGMEDLLKPGAGRLVGWLGMWERAISGPLAHEDGALAVAYEGRATVGGVACDVIRQDLGEFSDLEEYYFWWFVSAEDRLPRRLDAFFLELDGSANGIDVLTITDLKAGAEVPDSALALASPDGYQVKVVDPARGARAGGGGSGRPQPEGNLVGKPAPAWTLKDPAGIDHSLGDYRGKVLVVDFWATWCGYCKLAMPGLQALHEKYQGRGVEVIGITVWESGDPVKYMKDNRFTYTLLLNGDGVAPAYGIRGIPRLVVIGKDGSVVYDLTGYRPDAELVLSEAIDKALAAP